MNKSVIFNLLVCLKYSVCYAEDRTSGKRFPADILEKSSGGGGDRKPRFLTFNNDASHIRVEMVFAIPFLAIPIGGKPDPNDHKGVAKPQIDINVKSLLAMASIMFLLFFIIPKVVHLYFPATANESPKHSSQKRETQLNALNLLLERVEEMLHLYNVDFESCTQKALCWTLNNASEKVKQGNATGAEKLLDALSSIPSLKYAFGDTWLWSFIENAISLKEETASADGTCHKFNQRCSITQNGLSNAAGSLLKAIKNTRK